MRPDKFKYINCLQRRRRPTIGEMGLVEKAQLKCFIQTFTDEWRIFIERERECASFFAYPIYNYHCIGRVKLRLMIIFTNNFQMTLDRLRMYVCIEWRCGKSLIKYFILMIFNYIYRYFFLRVTLTILLRNIYYILVRSFGHNYFHFVNYTNFVW